MNQIIVITAVVLSYLVGAIPFGLIYSWVVQDDDLRDRGSGNIGATNVMREYSLIHGVIVLVLDLLKGALPTAFVAWSLVPVPGLAGILEPHQVAALCGAAAIAGHVYPIYLGFSGGKGVATSTGVFAVLIPIPLVVTFLVFAIGVGLTNYMSVGSLSGALTMPVITIYVHGLLHAYTILTVIIGMLVVWRHRENIQRLVEGQEKEFF